MCRLSMRRILLPISYICLPSLVDKLKAPVAQLGKRGYYKARTSLVALLMIGNHHSSDDFQTASQPFQATFVIAVSV